MFCSMDVACGCSLLTLSHMQILVLIQNQGCRHQEVAPYPVSYVEFLPPSPPPGQPWNTGIEGTKKTGSTEKSEAWGDQGNECISTPRSCLGQQAKVDIGVAV